MQGTVSDLLCSASTAAFGQHRAAGAALHRKWWTGKPATSAGAARLARKAVLQLHTSVWYTAVEAETRPHTFKSQLVAAEWRMLVHDASPSTCRRGWLEAPRSSQARLSRLRGQCSCIPG